jgi:ketosteroid isomerase-like protein
MSTTTPEQVLESIDTGINSGDLDSLAHGPAGVSEALSGFISMNGKLDLEVTRVLEVDDLALVTGVWSFNGTGPDGEPVRLAASNADVLRRQADGTWRFVIDNPWGTD